MIKGYTVEFGEIEKVKMKADNSIHIIHAA